MTLTDIPTFHLSLLMMYGLKPTKRSLKSPYTNFKSPCRFFSPRNHTTEMKPFSTKHLVGNTVFELFPQVGTKILTGFQTLHY